MNDNSTNTDLLIQYLDGELEGEALTSIREKIAASHQLAAELESLRLAKESVKTYGLKKNIAGIHTEMMKELSAAPVPHRIGIRRMLQYTTRIAAMLAIVLGTMVLYQYFSATPQQLFRNNYETFQLHETRGGNTASVLEDPFKKGDMAVVIAAFKKIDNPQPEDYFLNGIAALNLNHAPDAIHSFLALQQNNKVNDVHFFEEDAQYYLGLAYLQNNEPGKALPLFEHIHADQAHTYHRKINSWFMLKLKRMARH